MTLLHDAATPSSPRRLPAADTVSVIVPAVAGNADLQTCLERLRRLDPPCLEIVVAVDGGNEAAAAMAAGHGARVVTLPVRRGPAAARNAAAQTVRGSVLFFVDADVAVPSDTIRRVASALADHPECDAVIGSYDARPAAPNFLSQYKNLAHHFVHQTSREEACTFWSGCGAIRRDAFRRLGGFDERYGRPSVEDIELGMRLLASGGRVRLEKSLQVTHLKRWTCVSLLRSEIFDRALPWTRLILGAGRMPDDLNLRWSGRIAVIVAHLLALALVASPWAPSLLGWALLAAAALLLIDSPLAAFLAETRGVAFAARSLAWQWAHYLCSGIGFGLGVGGHLLERLRVPAATAPVGAPALSQEQECD
jgi:GT2 family glycosyltransferase